MCVDVSVGCVGMREATVAHSCGEWGSAMVTKGALGKRGHW